MMKKNLNILMYQDIKKFLIEEKTKYIVIQENSVFNIIELPNPFNEKRSFLKNYLAYDYDSLSIFYQLMYEKQYLPLNNIKENKYEIDKKIYQLKKHN